MSLYWIALNAIKGLGPAKIAQLLSHFETPEAVFRESSSSLRRLGVLSDASITQMADPKLMSYAEEQIQLAEEKNIKILTVDQPRYPGLLKEIFAPPPVLFVLGSLDVFKKHSIGVVGMRQPSAYGKNVTEFIVSDLSRQMAIVSGLALGIDTIAHSVCIKNGGYTVAVLGSGVDQIYPATNRKVAEQILDKGAIISEFPIGTKPLPYNFPRRNRIISGLSAGTLVMEARKKSGSLITAHYAMQQGRDVFSVPGPIFSDKSDGTFNLLVQGAIPVRTARDVTDVLEVVKNTCGKSTIISKVVQMPMEMLSSEEKIVFEILSDTPKRIDQIAEKIKKSIADLFTILLNLELKGAVQQVAGQQYIRV